MHSIKSKVSYTNFLIHLIPYIIFLCGVIYYASDAYSLLGFPLDDAWIHRVYSKSFAFGKGFQYNTGIQEAGSTSPLWAIVSSPSHWLESLGTNAVVITVKLLGVILGLLTINLIYNISKSFTNSQFVGIISASLFALEPRFLFSTLSGMETSLLLTLWLGALTAFISRRNLLALFLFSLTPVTRPEALITIPLALFGLLLITQPKKQFFKRFYLWLILTIPMLLWIIYCKYVTDHWLPNTYYLKAQPFHLCFDEYQLAWHNLTEHGFASLYYVFLIGILLFILWAFKKGTTNSILLFILLLLMPIYYILGVVGTRTISLDGYYWSRWIDPASLLLTVSFCIGFAILLSCFFNKESYITSQVLGQKYLKGLSLALSFFAIITFTLTIPSLYSSTKNRRDRLMSDSRAINIINVQTGKWINHNTPINVTIGVNDAGAIRYFGKRKTIDLMGLNNSDIAFGNLSFINALEASDWLAIFPSWFEQREFEILSTFKTVKTFEVPLKEYTICNCPGQTTKLILKKY
jgi:hypothetical protein